MTLSAALQGHWRRNWLRAPGIEDASTRVHWVQAGEWCADIRIPLVRPGGAARLVGCLAAMSGPDLALLLGAEGFAGRITLDGAVCTWHRDWNWRGFPCAVDAGTLWFDDAGHLIEDGVHAEYREDWEREPSEPWTAFALGEAGMLLTNAAGFLLALGTRGAAAWPDLARALRNGDAPPEAAAPAFASVYAMGRWVDGKGLADLSTQPFCEGLPVLALDGASARVTLPDFHGVTVVRDLPLTLL